MKTRQAIYAFFAGSALLLAGNVAFAQEENTELPLPSQSEERERVERIEPVAEDGFPLHELDSKAARTTTAASSRDEKKEPEKITAKKPADKSSAKKNDEDALSFNFLYYLIQKFKVSDLIEN